MPITKRAIKKLHHDKNVTVKNDVIRKTVSRLIKTMRKSPSAKALHAAYQGLDKAAKRKIFHANHAARIKSRLSNLLKK